MLPRPRRAHRAVTRAHDGTTAADGRTAGRLSVVVANAGPADRLAERMAGVLAGLGYAQTVAATALARQPLTEVLFAPGRDQEALLLASAVGVDPGRVRSPAGCSRDDDAHVGDLVLVVGGDQIQRFEGPAG